MLDTLLGSKQHMSQTFVQGTRVPVTWINVGPCTVTHIKNVESDGYWAIQLGYGIRKAKNTSKPLQGHFKKIDQKSKSESQNYPHFLREVRLEKEPNIKVGDIVKVTDIFKKGDVVAVTGVSKGKGFAGVIKRWGFAGGPRTHGQSDRERAPGSIGQGTTPGRVHKGKKMPGRMGTDRVTIKNLIVVDVNEENGLLALSGPVPGTQSNILMIRKIGEGKLSELVEEVPEAQVQQVEEEEGEEKSEGESHEQKKSNAESTDKGSEKTTASDKSAASQGGK
jgi:large subunit ribosomal protein L3